MAEPSGTDQQIAMAQRVSEQVTVDDAKVLKGTTKVGNIRVRRANVNGHSAPTLIARHGDGMSVIAVLGAGQDTATFPGLLSRGQHFVPDPVQEGGYVVQDSSGALVATIDVPWARDATGRDLSTSYSVDGSGNLVQHVDTTDAVFPIAADPRVTWGWYGPDINIYQWEATPVAEAFTAATATGTLAACNFAKADKRIAGMLKMACASLGFSKMQTFIDAVKAIADLPQGECHKIPLLYPNKGRVVPAEGNCAV